MITDERDLLVESEDETYYTRWEDVEILPVIHNS